MEFSDDIGKFGIGRYFLLNKQLKQSSSFLNLFFGIVSYLSSFFIAIFGELVIPFAGSKQSIFI